MSDTPRTDALLLAWSEANNRNGWGMRMLKKDDPQDPLDFARQLERENAELRGALENIVHRHSEDSFIPSEFWEDALAALKKAKELKP